MDAKEYVTLTNSASKRALFPINRCTKPVGSDDEDSLGHMSPLRDLSSPDRYSSPPCSPCWVAETPVKSCETPVSCDEFKENFGSEPRVQRVRRLLQSTPQKVLANIVNGTPVKENENEVMSSFKCLAKQKNVDDNTCKFGDFTPLRDLMKRKNIEETPDSITSKADGAEKICWKRKLQARSPEIKSDSRKVFDFSSSVVSLIRNSFYKPSESKARTSLFTDFMSAKKHDSSKVVEKSKRRNLNATYPGSYSRNRYKRRVTLGEMNVGVRHKVRRPKPKKVPLGNIKKSTEVPLISPEQRIEQYVSENVVLDRSTPVKRPRLNGDLVNLTSDSMGIDAIDDSNYSDTEYNSEVLVPDPNKKFFKTNRTMAIDHKAVVTVVNNVKIKVHKGKMALVSSPRQVKRMKKQHSSVKEKPFEEDNGEQQEMERVKGSVEEVIEKLNDELESQEFSKSDKFQNLPVRDFESGDNAHQIQSITSSTSSLALNDFKDVHTNECVRENSTGDDSNVAVESRCPETDTTVLFPVFHRRKGIYDSVPKKISPPKKIRPLGENQLQIDAGQSRFKAVQCKECGTLYHLGDPEDEIAHYNIHNNISTFRFVGWKNERVVKMYPDGGRVIVVYPDDPKPWVNKIKIVLDTVDQEMGFVDGRSYGISSEKVYLYILKSRIVGVLAAQVVDKGFKMLDTGVDGPDCCSEETYPVKCGISRIWVASDQRRKRIATSLLDCVRLTFMFDHILAKTEIAFSVPTELGKAFASHYMQTKEFMVYYK